MCRNALRLVVLATLVACHRAPSTESRDVRNACERALGAWRGDDVDAPDPNPSEAALGREMVRAQSWRITETTFETREGERVTREALRIVLAERNRCDVELTYGDARRTLEFTTLADARLRVIPTGGARVAMILRRE